MPAAAILRRVGFPTTLVLILVTIVRVGPVRAALSPPPWRLAQVFAREIWGPPVELLPVPVLSGAHPIPYEVP